LLPTTGAAGRVRPTDDVDIVVDVRVHHSGLRVVADWLIGQQLKFLTDT